MVLESWPEKAGSPSPRRIEIPSTLHELLVARLDRLRGLGKDLAQLCAVLGRDFNHSLIRAVSELDEMSLQQGLDILMDAGLLHRHGPGPPFQIPIQARADSADGVSIVAEERAALAPRAHGGRPDQGISGHRDARARAIGVSPRRSWEHAASVGVLANRRPASDAALGPPRSHRSLRERPPGTSSLAAGPRARPAGARIAAWARLAPDVRARLRRPGGREDLCPRA